MHTLHLLPEQDGYTVEESAETVVRTQLDGGAGRYRKVLFGVSKLVTCTWICDENEYDYLKMFYRVTQEGALPFRTQLIFDTSQLEDYECHFIPKSLKLESVKGLAYTVSATLEVTPINDDYTKGDETIQYLLLYFGPNYATLAKHEYDRLDPHVNIHIPSIFANTYAYTETELDLYVKELLGVGYNYKLSQIDIKINHIVNEKIPRYL